MSRRRLLGLLGMGLVGGGVAVVSGELSEEEQGWYRRLVYSGVDDEVIWSILGVKYGQADHLLEPLWSTNTLGFARIVYPEDGGYRLDVLEAVFYTDLESGERLENWFSPYTLREIPVNVPAPVAVSSFHSHVGPSERKAPGGVHIRESIEPPTTIGGDTWVTIRKRIMVTDESSGNPVFFSTEHVDYRARTQDLRSASPRVPATMHLEIVSSWLPWMGMGNRRGGLYTRARGAKVHTLDDAPASSRRLLERHYPDIARDPFGYLSRALAAPEGP